MSEFDLPQLLDDALKAQLLSAGSLTELVSNRIYEGEAEPGATMPLCIYQRIDGAFPHTSPRPDSEALYRITGWSANRRTARAIVAAAVEALKNKSLTVSGWSNYYIMPVGWPADDWSWSEGTKYHSAAVEIEMRTDKR